MSPLSMPVQGAALVLTGPALWRALVTQDQSLQVAGVRYAVVVVLCWVVFSFVQQLVAAASPGTGTPPVLRPSAPPEARPTAEDAA